MNRRWSAAAALAASGAMLALGVWLITDGSSDPTAAVVESVGHRPTATIAPTTAPTATTAAASPPTSSPAPALPATPARIVIPAISVDTDIVSVGLDQARAVEVPEDIREVGWYRHAAVPGSATGSAVLVAHRDGRVQGHGVFYDLGLLNVGDRVQVTTADGDRIRYRVVARELIQKSAFGEAAPDLFSLIGEARLTLISCGGYYDRNAGGYQANIVVTAVPEAS